MQNNNKKRTNMFSLYFYRWSPSVGCFRGFIVFIRVLQDDQCAKKSAVCQKIATAICLLTPRVYVFNSCVRDTQRRGPSVCVCETHPRGLVSSSAQCGDKRVSPPHRPAALRAQKAARGAFRSGHMVPGLSLSPPSHFDGLPEPVLSAPWPPLCGV